MRVWSVARTQDQVRNSMATLKPAPFPPGLELYYDVESDSGLITAFTLLNVSISTVNDLSGKARHGTLNCLHTTACRTNLTRAAAVCGDSIKDVFTEQVRASILAALWHAFGCGAHCAAACLAVVTATVR